MIKDPWTPVNVIIFSSVIIYSQEDIATTEKDFFTISIWSVPHTLQVDAQTDAAIGAWLKLAAADREVGVDRSMLMLEPTAQVCSFD